TAHPRPCAGHFSTWPRKRVTAAAAASWYVFEIRCHSSGSSRAAMSVAPTRSQKSAVGWRRSPGSVGTPASVADRGGGGGDRVGAAAREAPHPPQNFLFGGLAAPPCRH